MSEEEFMATDKAERMTYDEYVEDNEVRDRIQTKLLIMPMQ